MESDSNTDPECVRNINENQMTNTIIKSSSGSKPPFPPKDSKDKVVKRKPRQQSEVWEHFTKNEDDYSEPRVVCNYCSKDYASDTRRNGTSTL